MQKKYWKFLVQLRSSIEFLDLYYEASYRKDRFINIVLAIASSASIATWAIWKQYTFIWATIIAFAQIVAVIKPFLPYHLRIEYIPTFTREAYKLFVACEREWFNVASGNLKEKEINTLLFGFKERYVLIETGLIKCKTLPKNKKIHTIADNNTTEYFCKNYSEGG